MSLYPELRANLTSDDPHAEDRLASASIIAHHVSDMTAEQASELIEITAGLPRERYAAHALACYLHAHLRQISIKNPNGIAEHFAESRTARLAQQGVADSSQVITSTCR